MNGHLAQYAAQGYSQVEPRAQAGVPAGCSVPALAFPFLRYPPFTRASVDGILNRLPCPFFFPFDPFIAAKIPPMPGLFILSLDTEIAWGTYDPKALATHKSSFDNNRTLIRRLLALLNQHSIPATFAVV